MCVHVCLCVHVFVCAHVFVCVLHVLEKYKFVLSSVMVTTTTAQMLLACLVSGVSSFWFLTIQAASGVGSLWWCGPQVSLCLATPTSSVPPLSQQAGQVVGQRFVAVWCPSPATGSCLVTEDGRYRLCILSS